MPRASDRVVDRILIACNGRPPSSELAKEQAGWADRVIGADGGADAFAAHGLYVDEVVGDLDSVSEAELERLGADAVRKDPDPDATDLDKCLKRAADLGAREVHVLGASGGRLDHVLGSVASLLGAPSEIEVRLIDDRFESWIVRREATFDAPLGSVVSLMPFGTATGVTTSGLRWGLRDARLSFSTLGIHNEVASNPVSIRVAGGNLLLMRGRFVQPHA